MASLDFFTKSIMGGRLGILKARTSGKSRLHPCERLDHANHRRIALEPRVIPEIVESAVDSESVASSNYSEQVFVPAASLLVCHAV